MKEKNQRLHIFWHIAPCVRTYLERKSTLIVCAVYKKCINTLYSYPLYGQIATDAIVEHSQRTNSLLNPHFQSIQFKQTDHSLHVT